MVEAIGGDVLDFKKTILEPTSGDGAFTTYILKKRLESIKNNFEINILKALSTIYSVEMDKALVEKQRCNIYTVIINFLEKQKVKVRDEYLNLIKIMIVLNFIWGEFNTEISKNSNESGDSLFAFEDLPDSMKDILVFDMAESMRETKKCVKFAVWEIDDSKIQMHFEEVEV